MTDIRRKDSEQLRVFCGGEPRRDRVRTAGVRFGCVLADAGYGMSAPFCQALSERGLSWTVGIPGRQEGGTNESLT